jgi:hypothetical protein
MEIFSWIWKKNQRFNKDTGPQTNNSLDINYSVKTTSNHYHSL